MTYYMEEIHETGANKLYEELGHVSYFVVCVRANVCVCPLAHLICYEICKY
jgi:hypothetical protein